MKLINLIFIEYQRNFHTNLTIFSKTSKVYSLKQNINFECMRKFQFLERIRFQIMKYLETV